jgi:hypothetical protein
MQTAKQVYQKQFFDRLADSIFKWSYNKRN